MIMSFRDGIRGGLGRCMLSMVSLDFEGGGVDGVGGVKRGVVRLGG